MLTVSSATTAIEAMAADTQRELSSLAMTGYNLLRIENAPCLKGLPQSLLKFPESRQKII